MRLSFIGILVLISSAGFAQVGLPLLRSYNNSIGGSKSIFSITQDKRGILYFAIGEGLVQYDGVEFTTFPNISAYALVADASGVIYISGTNEFGFLESSSDGKIHYKSLMTLLNSPIKMGTANNIYATKDYVYCIAGSIVLEYNKKSNTVISYYAGKGLNFFNGFVKNDTLWISICHQGLRFLKDGKIYKAPSGDMFVEYQYGCMNCSLTLADDRRILAFGKTLVRYSDGSKPQQFFQLKSSILSRSLVQNSLSVTDNYQLLTTVNKGAILFDTLGQVLNRYYDSTGLQGNNVTYAYADRTHNIWLAFENNKRPLAKTEHGQDICLWDKTSNLDGGVLSMIRFLGVTYISTDDGLFYIDEDGHVIRFSAPLQFTRSMEEFKSADGAKLVTVMDNSSIWVIAGEKARRVHQGFETNQISQSKTNPSRLYVCDQMNLGYLLFGNGQWTYHKITNLAENMSLVEAPDGSLWLSSYNKSKLMHIVPKDKGNLLEPKAIVHYTSNAGIPGEYCQPLLFNNQVLFGTRTDIYFFDERRNEFMPWREEGSKFRQWLSGASVVVTDTLNHAIHMIIDKKLITLSIDKNGDTTLIDKPYKRFPDVGGISDLFVDETGALWATGVDGVIRYDKTKDFKNYDKDFECIIRKIDIGKDSTVFWGGLDSNELSRIKIDLDREFEKIVIKFAAPFFDREEETLYSYQLIGRDSQWSEWSRLTSKEFDDDLWEGTYTFEVKAKNIYGKESRIASCSFVVLPPWYRTWWSYSLYGIGSFLFIAGVVRWRTNNLRKKRIVLEKIISEKTSELRVKNLDLNMAIEELRTTNEKLVTTQKQLVVSEKMASLGQLTAGIAHEINNPINFISGGVQALHILHQELFDQGAQFSPEELEERKQEIAQLMGSMTNGVMRTATIIKTLRQFSSPSETIEEEPVDIHESIENALLLLGSKLTDARVVIIKECTAITKVKVNAAQISQVFINLIDNAIFALSDKNGDRIVRIRTFENADNLIVTIADNGGGIPEAVQPRIFEPFYTTKVVGKGTGLGLFICYSIIQKHGGTITFTSNSNGTTFEISIPIGGRAESLKKKV
ncbi:MAG: GHKL domain-containing protein [Bacteroidetes bacterium]|nr:GHKL domain-containing protein [Bacteroidota bacterium]